IPQPGPLRHHWPRRRLACPAAAFGHDQGHLPVAARPRAFPTARIVHPRGWRSEEHTSELQSRFDLVCRLLLEKKNIIEGVKKREVTSITIKNCCHFSDEQVDSRPH